MNDNETHATCNSVFTQAVYSLRYVPFPYLYLNPSGLVLFANTYTIQLNGFSLVEMVLQSIDQFVVQSLVDHLLILSNWNSDTPLDVAIHLKHKDGHHIAARTRIQIDTTAQMKIRGFHMFILNTVVEQREDVTPVDLQAAYQQLLNHVKTQTDFIQNYLHELKTPISTLSTSVYLLSHGGDAVNNRHIDVLSQQIDFLKDMVHAASEYTHAGQFDSTLNGQVLLINDVVSEMVDVYQHRFEAKSIALRVKAPAHDCHIMGDRRRLLQVFQNIFENAWRYTEKGSVTVAVNSDYERSLVFIIIQDTGIGIPAADLPRVFERFYRAENAKLHSRFGTGLGLSITKQIVEQHNGEIEIYSRQNAGTSIVITLPLVL